MRTTLLMFAAATLIACNSGGSVGQQDAGQRLPPATVIAPPNAGTADASTADAGAADAGAADAGAPDAGTPDAGTPDAGTPDAGTPDAGTPDAGTPDAGTPDAGTPDSGVSLLPSPGPPSPLIRFGNGVLSGGVHQAFNPAMPSIAGYAPAGWYLLQSGGLPLIDPSTMLTQAPPTDPLLGLPSWTFPTSLSTRQVRMWGSAPLGLVFELNSSDGVVSVYGGAGLILNADNVPKRLVDGQITLELDLRIPHLVTQPSDSSPLFHWFVLSGMYFHLHDPNDPSHVQAFLVQIVHAIDRSRATSFYAALNGVDAPMLSGILPEDMGQLLTGPTSDFQHLRLDVNKYLCLATRLTYGVVGGGSWQLPAYAKDPRNWYFQGYFFDLEHASGECTDPNPVYGAPCPAQYQVSHGHLEVGVQVANISLRQQAVPGFSDLCQAPWGGQNSPPDKSTGTVCPSWGSRLVWMCGAKVPGGCKQIDTGLSCTPGAAEPGVSAGSFCSPGNTHVLWLCGASADCRHYDTGLPCP